MRAALQASSLKHAILADRPRVVDSLESPLGDHAPAVETTLHRRTRVAGTEAAASGTTWRDIPDLDDLGWRLGRTRRGCGGPQAGSRTMTGISLLVAVS